MKLVASLLTTMQRSGPSSPISTFLGMEPFPLRLSVLSNCDASNCGTITRSLLAEHGCNRFNNRLPQFITDNFPLATAQGWLLVSSQLETLRTHEGIAEERVVANFIHDRFAGFGPKQSRNLLQMLGLTRYLIPIDSRVLKWMNKMGFPVPASPGLLAYRDYFEFVEDGLNELCRLAGIYPCILDAAVFGSFDGEDGSEWTEANATW